VLGGFDNFAGFQAAGADSDSLSAATDQRSYRLKIRVKAALGSIVGVAHTIPELWALAANLAAFRHYPVPPTGLSL